MNERIKELMVQAGTDVSGKWMSVDNATKLAELIVKDVIDSLQSEWYTLNNIPKKENENIRDIGIRVGKKSEIIFLINKIKKHYTE